MTAELTLSGTAAAGPADQRAQTVI